MESNVGKWKLYQDGLFLWASSATEQNLNTDLEKNVADESDAITADIMGGHVVVAGLLVQNTTGLAVEVTAGTGFVSGQRVRLSALLIVSGLPASSTGIKMYVQASRGPGSLGFDNASRAWPGACGFTLGALGADQMLLATVTTDGAGVTGISDNRAFASQLVRGPTALEKAALAGTGVTPPSGANKFVSNDDVRLTGTLPDERLSSNIPRKNTANSFLHPLTIVPATPMAPFVLAPFASGQLVLGLNTELISGVALDGLQNATNLNAGTLADGRLSTNVPLKNGTNTFTAQQTLAPASPLPPLILGANAQNQKVIGLDVDRLDGQEGAFYQNATNINAGTLGDGRLSANVPLKNAPGTFTAKPNFSVGAEVGSGNEVWHEGSDPKYFSDIRRTTAQTIANDGAQYTLSFDASTHDPFSLRSGNSIVIPATGNYLVTFNVAFQSNATGGYRWAIVAIDGTGSVIQATIPSMSGTAMLCGSGLIRLTATQAITLRVAHNATTNIDVLANPHLGIVWVGP